MRTVGTTTIDVKWLDNPYYEYNGDSSERFPVLLIDGKITPTYCTDGRRPKYFHKRQFVVKIGHENNSTRDIVKMYKKISAVDLPHFPRILAYDLRKDYLVEEFIPLQRDNINLTHFAVIRNLVLKYKLDDLLVNEHHDTVDHLDNWAVHKKTNVPIIYDFAT